MRILLRSARPITLVVAVLGTLLVPVGQAAAQSTPVASGPPVGPQVVHGRPAEAGEFGFLVALGDRATLRDRGWFRAQYCGGTLASPTHVITAAHCVVDRGRVEKPVRIVVGLPDASGTLDDSTTSRRVAEVIVNPDYREGNTSGDIAVLVLARPIDGAPTLPPVTRREARRVASAGSASVVAGWGSTRAGVPDGRGYPAQFRVGELTVFPRSACARPGTYVIDGLTFRGYPVGDVDPLTMLCAQGVRNDRIVDACVGDSGGPLVAGTGTRQRLIGVVSWGPNRCASRRPGVYTRVATATEFLISAGVPFGQPAGLR